MYGTSLLLGLFTLLITRLVSADLLLANQTVKLDLTGRLSGASCNDSDVTVINSLEDRLVSYLNLYATRAVDDVHCEFRATSKRQCENASVGMSILLTCVANMLSDNLVDSNKQQRAAIKEIMGRKSSEHFMVDDAKMTVRLFSNSEQRKAVSPSCAEDCSQVKKGPVYLCNCTSIWMLGSSCLPNVLLDITNIYSVNNTSCAAQHIIPSNSSYHYLPTGPISFEGLDFTLHPDSVSISTACNDTVTGLQLYVTASMFVEANRPQCGADEACVMKFNTEQLATVKSFFQLILSFVPQAEITGQVATALKVDTSLMCENGSFLAANGKCCSEDCDCGSRPPVNITIVLHFNVMQLSSAHCSQLNYTKLVGTIVSWMRIGGELVRQFGGHMELCANPTTKCDEADGAVTSLVAHVPLKLILAPYVSVSSQDELRTFITNSIRGFIIGADDVLLGDGKYVSTKNFTIEFTNDCTIQPLAPTVNCQPGTYVRGKNCRLCPIGQYTNQSDQNSCIQCPEGRTTTGKGSSSVTQCVAPCPSGHFSGDGYLPCDRCHIGSYQPYGGQTSCRKCPPQYTTAIRGATGPFQCTSVTVAPTTTTTTLPPCNIVTHPTVNVGDNFFTSSNYPNNYDTLQRMTYNLQCASNKQILVFIIDQSLGSGDSLSVGTNQYTGTISVPVSVAPSTSSATITFVSDCQGVSRGFKIAYGCYGNDLAETVRKIAFDCEVRKYLKTRDDVIRKLLQVFDGEISILAAASDPAFTPLTNAFINGGTPC